MARLPFGGSAGVGVVPPAQTKIIVIPDATYKAAAGETSHVFNIPAAFQNFDSIAGFLVLFDGGVQDIGTMELQARINAVVAASYSTFGSRFAQTGVQTAITLINQTRWTLADVTALPAQNAQFAGYLQIMLGNNEGPTDNNPAGMSECVCTGAAFLAFKGFHGFGANNIASITSVEILASTQWSIGTRITIYALKRVDT